MPSQRGVIASSQTTTNGLGACSITYPAQAQLPIITHDYFFVVGLTLYVIFPETISLTTATFRVWAAGVVTLLTIPLFGVLPAANVPVFLQMSDPTP